MSVLPNPCSFCDAKCCKSYIITVTAFDVLRVMEATKQEPKDFVQLHRARLLSFDPDTTLDMADDPFTYVLGFKSHPCIFLGKDNLCTIHKHAPLSCRRYPYTLTHKLSTRFCPLLSQILFKATGPDLLPDDLQKELTAYKSIVKEWNKKPRTMPECVPFLLHKAK